MADMRYEDLKVIDVKSKAFDYGITKPEIPEYISNNLKYEFFHWQKEALENFLTYEKIKRKRKSEHTYSPDV